MGQREKSGRIKRAGRATGWVVALAMALTMGCDRTAEAPRRPPATHPTVASLVPSATDLIVGMGGADHLVAIGNYDHMQEALAGLPRAGDYQTIDWERLAAIRPDVMIVFQAPDRLPAGLREKASALGIRLINVRTETLADIHSETIKLGAAIDEPAKARAAVDRLKARLDAVSASVAGRPVVRTLLTLGDTAENVAGIGTFLDDVLKIAGGQNVVAATGWPAIDRESLLALDPDAVVVLLSGVPAHVEAEARRVWGVIPVAAVDQHRVSIINAWYATQSGFHVAELAETMAKALHPGISMATTARPTTLGAESAPTTTTLGAESGTTTRLAASTQPATPRAPAGKGSP